ncbi:hypothetical protein [Streptomyces cyaneofuscatus]|uniref:hypothetical protein n=1 Tax=Streptomyces cyaneofuscatus TaxID=66883 RepID=UPI0036570674
MTALFRLPVERIEVVATSLFEGVRVGLLLAVAKTAWDISHVHVETVEGDGRREGALSSAP